MKAEKIWTITYLDNTPSLKVEAESFVKAVEKVKDKLSYADLRYAHVESADLSYANLERARLSGADYRCAYFNFTDLKGAKGLPRLG